MLVPFGKRSMTGYVLALRDTSPDDVKLKEISKPVDEVPLLSPPLMKLAGWISEHYVHPLGEVLKAMLPASIKGKGRKAAGGEEEGSFPRDPESPVLTPGQAEAFEAVAGSIEKGVYNCSLLYGVTGSGKTEVYLRCIEKALSLGRSALVLVPEIALIPQTTARFRRRFRGQVAVLHSRLTGPQRAAIWKEASGGGLKVVIGPRSAVFVPLKDLGIIVVDEEQDSSFKQEEKPHYNAVEVAKFRGRNENAALLLGSATPSLESYREAGSGEMAGFRLDSRPAGGTMPSVEIVDMRQREGIFSEELLGALEECLERGEQAVILINRRGHANYQQCGDCGWIDRCPDCSISLTYHSRGHRMRCHYCGYSRRVVDRCPRCGSYKVRHRGEGTQRIEIELGNLLPGAGIVRMDLDTTSGKTGHLDILEMFAAGRADILLGTQMVAKGHHYPNVTVAGVLSSDGGMNFPDFRAAERTFQLLSQAAGRTGRGNKKGRVIIQSRAPDHYIFNYLARHDFDGFASIELGLRKELDYPPFSRLMLFTVSSLSRAKAERAASAVRDALALKAAAGGRLLGPAPALVEMIRKRYRFHVLVKGAPSPREKKDLVSAARGAVSAESGVELQWNVDPVNLF